MLIPGTDDRGNLVRHWVPLLFLGGGIGVGIGIVLAWGDLRRIVPIVAGYLGAGIWLLWALSLEKRRMARLFHASTPEPLFRSLARSVDRIAYGPQCTAAGTAAILALYGRVDEATRQLEESVSWRGAPPVIQAQKSVARALIAYVRGSVEEGLGHAATAVRHAAVDRDTRENRTATLALRTYENLGVALAGRATNATRDELRKAFARLPLLGRILAAWGLATSAQASGDATELRTMQQFLERNAPHLAPILASVIREASPRPGSRHPAASV
jgi:hypothetical protein